VKLVRVADVTVIEELVGTLSEVATTCAGVGDALGGELPAGFRHDRHRVELGSGEATFLRAVAGLQSWHTHRLPGIRVLPPDTEIRPGATVIVTLGTNWLAIAAPCRIVGVVDEPTRWGFAYGTLPGHPEEGEEAFVASIAADGTVAFEITAFSRPADTLVRLSGPLGRVLQRRAARGYARALRRFVDRSEESGGDPPIRPEERPQPR
jgi:uncharacterized protein (UPF0548 family)